MARAIKSVRENVPTIVKQQIRGYLSWLGLAGRQKEEEKKEEKKEESPKRKREASDTGYSMYM
jgi:threonine/homoserine/homoserine lactone efflux protein